MYHEYQSEYYFGSRNSIHPIVIVVVVVVIVVDYPIAARSGTRWWYLTNSSRIHLERINPRTLNRCIESKSNYRWDFG